MVYSQIPIIGFYFKKNIVLWKVTLCTPVKICYHIREACCFHVLPSRWKQHATLSTTLCSVTSQPQEPKISHYFYKFLPVVFHSGIRTGFIRVSQVRFRVNIRLLDGTKRKNDEAPHR
jgi:hypothetical protein